jgi:hypothetical protein
MQNFCQESRQGTTFFIWKGALATIPDTIDDQR